MLRILLVVLLVPYVVIGCKSKERKYPWRHSEARTPAGYLASWQDQGSTSELGIQVDQVHGWLDARIQEAAAANAARYDGPDEAGWLAVASRHRWVLEDNCCFPVSDGSGRWAAGERIPQSSWGSIIRAGLYVRRPNATGGAPCDQVPASAPPWTVRANPQNPSECRWGELVAGREFSAVRHELGHGVWWNFEHPELGWVAAAHERARAKPLSPAELEVVAQCMGAAR